MLFRCPASSHTRASLACCAGVQQKEEIYFDMQNLVSNLFYLRDDISVDLLQQVIDDDLLSKDVLIDPYFMPQEIVSSDAERMAMHRQFIFDYSYPIRRYEVDDVPKNIAGKTLWEECVHMVTGSFSRYL